MFCKYRDIFGKVGKGVHSYRICNIAIVDVVCTILLALLIYWIKPRKINLSFPLILLILFIFGIICHRLFCVRTTIDKLLFK